MSAIGSDLKAIGDKLGRDVMKSITPPFLIGFAALVIGFIAQYIWGDY